jgi:hypothetical protein
MIFTVLYGLSVLLYLRSLVNGKAKSDPKGYHREFLILTIIWVAATYFLGFLP